jgi:molecular chaperone DnaK
MIARRSNARRRRWSRPRPPSCRKMYEQSAASSPAEGGGSAAGAESKKEDVLDAEFEEVKESDRKKA